jgi:hypothetical protein
VELRPGGGGEPLSPVPNRAPQIWQTVGTPPRATVSNKRLPRTAAGEEFTHGLPDLGRRSLLVPYQEPFSGAAC